MCGIYGEFFNSSKLTSKETFKKQNDLNIKRGPDSDGYWTNNSNCQLGFRRLSILDLSENGNQPMLSMNGKYAMVFNGEIYNFKELKKELLTHKYHFKSTGDTEVLINYFECFGIDTTLDKIDGMFAISLFDIAEEKLYLIRDFAGIKPLFYGVKENNIVFGSRYDQIAKHSLFYNQDINQEVLKLYLKMHYVPAPFGILEQTYQVEPGQYISFNSEGNIKKFNYWSFPNINEADLITDKKEAISALKKSLQKSVDEQLIADVPLGTFLSGGIDSPLISYCAKKSKKDIIVYTIGSDSKVHDESDDALEYAKQIDCEVKLKKMESADAKVIIEDCMNNLQEPFADFSLLPTYELTREASQNFKVMLSGDGGDELFFGYERFYSVYKNLKWNFIPKKLRYFVYGIDKIVTKNKNVNECLLEGKLSNAHQGLHSRTIENDLLKVMPSLKNVKEKELPFYNYTDKTDKLTFLNNMRKAEFYGMMQKTLAKVDRMSMANSIEIRVPFLQKRFIEEAVKIHPKLSLFKNNKKMILKDLLRSFLPNAPIDNQKRGFSIPLSKWLKEELKEDVYKALFDNDFITKFSINKQELAIIWNKHQNGEKDYKWFIFTMYSLQQWHKNLKK